MAFFKRFKAREPRNAGGMGKISSPAKTGVVGSLTTPNFKSPFFFSTQYLADQLFLSWVLTHS